VMYGCMDAWMHECVHGHRVDPAAVRFMHHYIETPART
jgi:hypothetical protein